MHITVKTPATELPVTVAEAKGHCIIDHNAHDAMLEQFIKATVEQLSPVNGWLGRAVMQTTFEAHLERFKPIIRLPYPPLVSVESIKYLDRDGVEQTVDDEIYEVVTTKEPGYIALKSGESWPDGERVVVEFIAGFGEVEEVEPEEGDPYNIVVGVPEPIRHYILLSVAEAYARRELSDPVAMTPNKFWLDMLEGWRFRFAEDD